MIVVTLAIEEPGEDTVEHRMTWPDPVPEDWAYVTSLMVKSILKNPREKLGRDNV